MLNILRSAQKASAADLLLSVDPSYTQVHIQNKMSQGLELLHIHLISLPPPKILFGRHGALTWKYKSTNVYEWNPSEKRKELFHCDSRFILAVPEGKRLEGDLAAFVMFRFDTEEDMDGADENVLYCYEIQVTETCRGAGLGKVLVDIMKKLATKWGMKKVMLTGLLANTSATRFYHREGFVVDAISPEDENYHILSWSI